MKRIVVVLFAVGALASVLFVASLLSKPFSEGVESIANGYYVVDTGDMLMIGYRDADGSMNQPFGPRVMAFQLRSDELFVARLPYKLIVANGLAEDVYEGGGCQYWRVNTRTHEATQVSKEEAKVDC